MSKKNAVVKSTFIIIIFSLVSKFLGLFREMLIASKFGSGIETDSFFVALTATGLITGFITTAIGTTFIPVLTEIEALEGKEGKVEHTNNMLNIILFISIFLVGIGFVGAPLIIRLLAKGFEGEQLRLTIKLARIGFPVLFFGSAVGIFTAFLQSENKFTATAAIGLPLNLVYIVFLLVFSAKFGVIGLMIAAVLAVLSQLFIQIPSAIKSGYRYKLKLDFKDEYVKSVLKLSLPVLIGVAINDLNAIVDRTLASDLAVGSISALNYANKLKGLILGVFITAIVTVIFPLLSKASSNENLDGMKKIMKKGIDLVLLITVPATIGLIIFATPITQLVFERGEFGSVATRMTSGALIFYSVGLIAMALQLLLTRVYYSIQDTKTPMINGAISVAFNIGLSLILVRYMDHLGLALATSIASSVASILLLWGLRKKIGSLGTKSYIKSVVKTGAASLIMGVISYTTYTSLLGLLGSSKLYIAISLGIAVAVALIVYGVLCYLFKVEEFIVLLDAAKKKLKIKKD